MRTLIGGVLALLVGSSIISAGIFLGLKNQTVVQVIAPPTIGAVKAGEASALSVVRPEVDQRVFVQVRHLMEERRGELARMCKAGVASDVNLEFRLIFNAEGHLLSYGVNDPAEESLRGVAKCAREHRPEVTVEAPGKPTTVQFVLAI